MASLPNLLAGYFQFAGTSKRIPGLRLELMVDNIWVSSGSTDVNGDYDILLQTAIATAINGGTKTGELKVYNAGRLIQSFPVTIIADDVNFDVDEADFDAQAEDTTVAADEGDYLAVGGNLKDANNAPMSGIRLLAYESGFRSRTLVGQAYSYADGSFELKIALRSLTFRNFEGESQLVVEALDEADNVIASSDTLRTSGESLNAELVADTFAIPVYSAITTAMAPVIGSAQVNTITEDEAVYIARVSGQTVEDVMAYVGAAKMSTVVNGIVSGLADTLDSRYLFGLVKSGHLSRSEDLRYMDTTGLEDTLLSLDDKGFYDGAGLPSAAAAVATIVAFQVEIGKKAQLIEEKISIGTALNTVLNNSSEADQFIAYSQAFTGDDMAAFWEDYSGDENLKLRTQRALQLLAITGFQPETAAFLITDAATDGIAPLAKKSKADWLDTIDEIEALPGGLQIPLVIREAFTHGADFDEAGAKNAYADQLFKGMQDLHPLTALSGMIEANPALLDDPDNAPVVAAFLDANPGFDFRLNSIYDIGAEDSPLTLESDTDVDILRAELAPFQRLMRLTGPNPGGMSELKLAGINSALAVTALSSTDFVADFSAALGGAAKAGDVYAQALKITAIATQAATVMQTGQKVFGVFGNPYNAASADPELRTLFGSFDQCSCDHCMSVYSPSAYFVDILQFLKTHSLSSYSAFTELNRRRPDLRYIDLTCKNANTPLPYVDLVNELLERMILKASGLSTVAIPESYQTTGTAAQLAALPEHTYRNNSDEYVPFTEYTKVYDVVLRAAIYPFRLPFNLALEEARTYLKHLGYTRYGLMELFQPVNPVADAVSGVTSNDITEYNLLSESVSLSKESADIIVKATPGGGGALPKLWWFYGFSTSYADSSGNVTNFPSPTDTSLLLSGNWGTILRGAIPTTGKGGLDVLVHQLKITYKELLQLLTTDFLNPVVSGISHTTGRRVEIQARSGAAPDTCQLNELYLDVELPGGMTEADFDRQFFDKMHRFVRFWRGTETDVYALDSLLRAVNSTTLTITDYKNVIDVIRIARQTGLDTVSLATWAADIDIHRYQNFDSERQDEMPSLYDRLFRNKSVQNPPDPAFDNPSAITGNLSTHLAALGGAFGINDADLNLLLGEMGLSSSPTTLGALSRLYAASQLAKGLRLPVADLIRYSRFAAVDLGTLGSLTFAQRFGELESLMKLQEDLRQSRLSLAQVEYLLSDVDEAGAFRAPQTSIEAFYTQFRNELRKVKDDTLDQSLLTNTLVQQFVSYFGVSTDIQTYLLEEMILMEPGVSLKEAYLDPEFISHDNGQSGAPYTPEQLTTAYRRMEKAVYWVRTLRLSKGLLAILFEEQEGLRVWNPQSLEGDSALPLPEQVDRLIRYTRWAMVRDRFAATEDQMIAWAKASIPDPAEVAVDPTAAALELKAAWVAAVGAMTGWTADEITQLVGKLTDLTPGGLLHTILVATQPGDPGYPAITKNDFFDSDLVWRISDIMAASKNIGLSPELLAGGNLSATIVLADSRYILNAARAKHSEEAWLKAAKPLRDPIRDKQRQALVDYMVANPVSGSSADKWQWKNENELYAHLLIDPEMKPCMLTSRIKQAICSVQLYVDRVSMNLEYQNYDRTKRVVLKPSSIEQWQQWRKWYRIWEANRKVFLYPENWIEPELRDDKTPFFRELETTLLQDEVTLDKVEDAYLEYFEKMDEVARLQPVTSFHEIDADAGIDIVHVIARTYAKPHRYHYRRLQNEVWSPWEAMNIDPATDHLTAHVWNRRLHLFWLTFVEKQVNEEDAMGRRPFKHRNPRWLTAISGKAAGLKAYSDKAMTDLSLSKDWNVIISWSQYKDGKWLAPKSGRDTMELVPSRVPLTQRSLESFDAYNATAQTQEQLRTSLGHLLKRGEVTYHEFFRNRLYLESSLSADNTLSVNVTFCTGVDEAYMGFHLFRFKDSSTDPEVIRYSDEGIQFLAPPNTFTTNMRFVQAPVPALIGKSTNSLKTDGYVWERSSGGQGIPSRTNRGYYVYPADYIYDSTNVPYAKKPEIILNNIPYGIYTVTARSNMMGKGGETDRMPMQNNFFFEDKVNTYFVRRRAAAAGIGTTNLSIREGNGAGLTPLADFYYEGYFPAWTAAADPAVKVGFYPESNPTGKLTAASGGQYYFQTFYHPHIHAFIGKLNRYGIAGLLQLSTQVATDSMAFGAKYLPTALVHSKYPDNTVDFTPGGTYSIYNWEIFFHVPMIVAQRLSENQQFDQARQWFHYIFDPTCNVDAAGNFTGSKQRFWRFRPFYDEAGLQIVTLAQLMANINQYTEQIAVWEKNPFQPHAIARLRRMAYMKNVVMKYLDNLIAWGDQLFRRDTIESINEAIQLYILAANILGERPQEVPRRAIPTVSNFTELNGLDAFSNALVDIETFIGPNAAPGGVPDPRGHEEPKPLRMQYFCLPANDKLLKYWDTVAERLFNIRNCRNIDGVERSLPLYEPPIDPALLVRAAAMGVSAGQFLNELTNDDAVYYRFQYVLQKANELTADVRGLAGALLSALEKKDAEVIALMRSGHELIMLDKMRQVKEMQLDEAKNALEALRKTREVTALRWQYYRSRPYMNAGEKKQMESIQTGMVLQVLQQGLQTAGSALAAVPQFHAQVIAAVGTSFGGQQLQAIMQAIAGFIGIAATINSTKGSMAGTMGGYDRRRDDWNFQADSAERELNQVDRQILGAEIRIDIAKRELANHEQQVENTQQVDDYMRSKFTNVELYSWMITQVKAVYFQSYQMAFDLAKKAERCFKKDLPLAAPPSGGFIKMGYWDSLRQGLMAGERLQNDLRTMDTRFMENNARELELTKHVSLALIDPAAILELRINGTCAFDIPEYVFDLDFPGHYLRRIRSVSISLPCVAGPYTTIGATLTNTTNELKQANGTPIPTPQTATSIATSSGQNDAGVFEMNFRDERYLPFEGRGVIGHWTLTLMENQGLRQFDYDTITDVIIQFKYAARHSGTKETSTLAQLEEQLGVSGDGTLELPRYFSLKHEFPNEWFAYAEAFHTDPDATLQMMLQARQFPFFAQSKSITISSVSVLQRPKSAMPGSYKVVLSDGTETWDISLSGEGGSVDLPDVVVDDTTLSWQLIKTGTPDEKKSMDELFEDLLVIVYYKLS